MKFFINEQEVSLEEVEKQLRIAQKMNRLQLNKKRCIIQLDKVEDENFYFKTAMYSIW